MRQRQAHDQALFQLFVRDPINGIKIELSFAAEEVKRAGRRPTRAAAGAAHCPDRFLRAAGGRAEHGFPRSHGPSEALVNGEWLTPG